MEVLVVGNTAYVDDDFCAKAFPGDHVQVVAAQDTRRDESSPHASWKELLQHGSGLRVRPRGLPIQLPYPAYRYRG